MNVGEAQKLEAHRKAKESGAQNHGNSLWPGIPKDFRDFGSVPWEQSPPWICAHSSSPVLNADALTTKAISRHLEKNLSNPHLFHHILLPAQHVLWQSCRVLVSPSTEMLNRWAICWPESLFMKILTYVCARTGEVGRGGPGNSSLSWRQPIPGEAPVSKPQRLFVFLPKLTADLLENALCPKYLYYIKINNERQQLQMELGCGKAFICQ